ncbi:MAG: Crp/Fnr family transcriptional regulator [Burkholderiaceae bacterium]|jgi:CRP-like cAMP-binding protein|nr:Crp/Fnr family transcriptional regulator [Burkholderiaceae bacterium]
MTMVSSLDLIRRVPLFSSLTDAQAEAVAAAVVKHRFKRGEVIVEKGKRTGALFILLNGRARVLSCDRKGREVILAVLQPSHHIGEMSLIDGEPHSATVQAEVQTDVLRLDGEQFVLCLSENASLAHAVMRGLALRLRQADHKIESLALLDVYGRVARALLEFAEDTGEVELLIRDRVSRQDVAKMIGASREMVSRVMKDLEKQGHIKTLGNGSIRIKSNLQEVAGDPALS